MKALTRKYMRQFMENVIGILDNLLDEIDYTSEPAMTCEILSVSPQSINSLWVPGGNRISLSMIVLHLKLQPCSNCRELAVKFGYVKCYLMIQWKFVWRHGCKGPRFCNMFSYCFTHWVFPINLCLTNKQAYDHMTCIIKLISHILCVL